MKKENSSNRTVIHRTRYWAVKLFLTIAIILCIEAPSSAKVYLRVGLLNEPKNFNPFGATDSWTKKLIKLIYQPLYLIDPETSNLIPWLAADRPIYDPERKTVTFHLRQMKWDDGTEFNAEDVVFTANVFKRFKSPRYHANWEFVKNIEL